MADRYLLESGSPDGYLLEDSSGVLLLEGGAALTADLSQTLGAFTSSATATIATDADLAQTLGAVVLSADGDVATDADLSVSLGAVSISAAAGVKIAAALANTLGTVSVSGAAQAAIAAVLSQTLGAVTLSADATVAQPEVAAGYTGRNRGVVYKRGRRKKSFIGVPDSPVRVEPPVTSNPITAGVTVALGAVQISASASMGEAPAKRVQRRAVAALLLH